MNKKTGRKLIALISGEEKTPEQIANEAKKAFKKYCKIRSAKYKYVISKKLIKSFLILIGILLLAGLSFGAVKANDYLKVKKLIKIADKLSAAEDYQTANDKLNLTQSHWATSGLRKEIDFKLELNKQMMVDKENHLEGLARAGGILGYQQDYQAAKNSFLKVSILYPKYKEVQDEIVKCQKKIDEANDEAEKEVNNAANSSSNISNDPFPTHPGYGECDKFGTNEPDLNGNLQLNPDKVGCEWEINDKYRASLIEWYVRHGQKIPDSLLPNNNTGSTQKNSTCKWNPYAGIYGGFDCTTK